MMVIVGNIDLLTYRMLVLVLMLVLVFMLVAS